ncbi:HutD family protein [Aquabacterium sp. A7-Y]|uniref:HutD/Ves family protein n=1 Tax=Aquabacterium sp. A7-Y TaxID=1349605 RepID=UPI00223E4A71|nr:HutD family protein [Aquabacterium sp. A7-Y]MCW7536748.1 HutD family protein [Aquabacterium sp. A7-Y]
MPFELFDLNEIPKVPWKNGAGLMRQIAVEPRGAGYESLDWHLAWAETTKNSPFSSFPGIDRSIVLLRGAGLRLTFLEDMTTVHFNDPKTPVFFKGEAKLHAEPIDGPTENLSILLRRDRFWSSATWVDKGNDLPPADAVFVLCMTGAVRLVGGDSPPLVLHAQQAALWRKGADGIRIEPVAKPPLALAVRLLQRNLQQK